MRERLRGSLLAGALMALVGASGCATTNGGSCLDPQECVDSCATGIALVALLPCIIVGGAGFVAGACTRCGEGDNASALTSSPSAEAELRAAEIPAPPAVADRMSY
jgi:hypothetical protein